MEQRPVNMPVHGGRFRQRGTRAGTGESKRLAVFSGVSLTLHQTQATSKADAAVKGSKRGA